MFERRSIMRHPIQENAPCMHCTRRRSRGAVRSQKQGRPATTSIRTIVVCITQMLLLVLWIVPNTGQAIVHPDTTRRRISATLEIPRTIQMTESLSSHRRDQDVFTRPVAIGRTQAAETRQSTTRKNLCQLNDKGLYTTNPEELTNGENELTEVNYNYQTSIVAGTSFSVINNDVIPDVDRAITTAILPSLFPAACSGSSTRRQIQEGAGATLVAISAQRADQVVNGQSCVVSVPNSICYVSQGSTVVVSRGMSNEEVNQMVKDAVQVALQSGNIASSVSSGLVLDVSAISDSLQSLPPVGGTQTSRPVAVPMPTTLPPQTRPPLPNPTVRPATDPPVIVTNAPIPYSRLTSAPFTSPVDPGPSGSFPTKAPSKIFTDSPIGFPTDSTPPLSSPTTRPPMGRTTASPSGTSQTREPTTASENNTPSPTMTSSSKEEDQARGSGKKKIEWWAWLLISISGACVLFCLYTAVVRRFEGDRLLSSSGLKNSSHLGGNATDDDNPDGFEYEPPPNSNFAPAAGSFSITPNSSALPTNDDPAAAFVNNATKDNEDDDYESYTDAEDVDDLLEYEDEEAASEEESEGERNGVVDQESYYDDEDVYEASEVSEGGWGNQQPYESRY